MKTYTVTYIWPQWFKRETAVIANTHKEAVLKALAQVPLQVNAFWIDGKSVERKEIEKWN